MVASVPGLACRFDQRYPLPRVFWNFTLVSTESEHDLVARLRRGDDDAFESLLRDQLGRLLAIARRILRHEEDAQDAVQEAMLSAFQKIDSFQGDAKLYTWLHRIVINASLLRLRIRKRSNERPINELVPQYLQDGHRRDPGPPWRGRVASGAYGPDSEF